MTTGDLHGAAAEVPPILAAYDFTPYRRIADLGGGTGVLTPEARLLVLDAVVPPGNDPHYAKMSDVELLTLAGGRERREDEWQRWYETAGLELTSLVPTGSPITVMELRRC